jgi:cytochrome o ubiquinol oxidase subunit 2
MTTSKSRHPGFRRPATSRGSWVLRALALGALPFLASCSRAGVIDPQGPIAAAEWLLMINATEIMLVVVVPVILATLGVAWWFRASNKRANHDPHFAYEGSIEFVTW